jgi:hypothetical protein
MTSPSEAPRSSWAATDRANSASMRLGGVAVTALLMPEKSAWIEPPSCDLNGVPPVLTCSGAAVAPRREPVVADPEKRIRLGFRISPPFFTVYRPDGSPT